MRCSFIESYRLRWPVSVMCRVLKVSRSAYYAWRGRGLSERSRRNLRLLVDIRQAFEGSRRTYGSPRIHAELQATGVECSRKHVAKLMRAHGIQARYRRRFKVTTQSNDAHRVAENLLDRDFGTGPANRRWVCDMTYIWTAEGWLYLAAVVDVGNRMAIGWAMSNRMSQQVTLDALDMAFERQKPPRGLLHHSDRGSQYTASDYRRALESRGIACSMSRKGNCWDNAPMESFFSTLKTELISRRTFATRNEAKSAIFEYIEVFYNRQRRHSVLGYLSPVEYQQRMEKA